MSQEADNNSSYKLRVSLRHCHICEVINDTLSRRDAHGLPFVGML